MSKFLPILAFLICLMLSCKKEAVFIDPELAVYIDRFLEEAAKRELEVDVDNLQAFILPEVTEGETRLCGKGYSPIFGDNIRRIDISQFCWEFATDIEKEILVFHELGHALLDREHQSSKMQNGRNRSIMFSGATCNVYTSYTDCHTQMRQFYINELFNERTSNPVWSVRQYFRRTFLEDNFDTTPLTWELQSADTTTPIQLSLSQDSTQFYSAPASLLLEQTTSTSTGLTTYAQRVASVGALKVCSNINIAAMIKTENLGTGWLEVHIQYPSVDKFGNPLGTCSHQFTIRESAATQAGFTAFTSDVFCIPGGQKDFEVRLALHATTPAKVYVDDIQLTLWD